MIAVHTWVFSGAGAVEFGSRWTSVIAPLLASGLTLFFTLSGFLLYRPFAAAILRGEGTPSTKAFLRNRALRILPAYWVVLFAIGLMGVVAQSPDERSIVGGFENAPAAVLNALLLQSYVPDTLLTGIQPAWSLSVEVVFYLSLPLLAFSAASFAAGRGRKGRIAAVCGPALLLLGTGLIGKFLVPYFEFNPNSNDWPDVFYWSFFTNADLFCWGMLAAVIVSARDQRLIPSFPHRWLGLLGIAVAGLATMARDELGDRALFYSTAMAFACGLVVLWVALSYSKPRLETIRGGPIALLESRPVVFAGVVSYSAYLWHVPVIAWLTEHDLMRRGWTGVAINLILVIGVTMALAYLTYRFVEAPALRRKARMVPRRVGERLVAPEPSSMEAAP